MRLQQFLCRMYLDIKHFSLIGQFEQGCRALLVQGDHRLQLRYIAHLHAAIGQMFANQAFEALVVGKLDVMLV